MSPRRLIRFARGEQIHPSYDPGMGEKMGPAGFAALPDLVAGRPVDVSPLLDRARFVDLRIDCADFRALTLARVVHADLANARGGTHDDDAAPVPDVEHGAGARTRAGDSGPGTGPNVDSAPWRLPIAVRERIRESLTGFRYSLDVPGDDSMCLWSENHQVVAAVAEHAAGLAYPDAEFTASGLTGAEHAGRAAGRLRTWLADRFRIGFVEWLSPTYYEEDAAALAVLVDVAADDDLRERARGVLDLLVLDLALHSAGGLLVGSAGRAYGEQKLEPETQQVAPVLAELLGPAVPGRGPGTGPAAEDGRSAAADRLGGLVRVSSYRAPEVARAIVAETAPLLVRASFGLEVEEVAGYVDDPRDLERTGLLLWSMESFTDPESVVTTMELMERWQLWNNRFLAPLGGFRRLPRRSLPALVRGVDPATRGVSIRRADVTTWRRGGLALSSAQHHHAGAYGDQQHLWQATLPGGVAVLATHPGRAMFDDVARNFSPSAWTGNGRNPEVAQDGQVLLALHRLGGRHGYLERERHRWSHLLWPTERFERAERGDDWLVARSGDGLVGVRSLRPLRVGDGDELVQAGLLTGWAVVVADAEEGFEAFRDRVREASLETRDGGSTLVLRLEGDEGARATEADRHTGRIPAGEWRLHWRGALERDGVPLSRPHPRLAFGDTEVERFPERITVHHGGHMLELTERGRVGATR
ncbi:hypothetical protein ACPYO6_07005 [Georgenia sp. Z1344]|uniref:hypothetical protein n=1 Tax=Georgenia sp. Z1344 TaxID=3416706 RepID=UPI003CEAB9A3